MIHGFQPEHPEQFSQGGLLALSLFNHLRALLAADLESADADTFSGCVINLRRGDRICKDRREPKT